MNGRSNDRVSRIEISVHEVIPHCSDVPPRQMGCRLQCLVIEPADGLTNLDEANTDSVEDQPVSQRSSQQVSVDLIERESDVMETLPGVSAHRGIASFVTWRNSGFKALAGTTSTSVSSSSESERVSAPNPTSPTSGSRSTRRSISLVACSDPLATLPKTRTLWAPCSCASRRTSSRRRANRRARTVSGSSGGAEPVGVISIER